MQAVGLATQASQQAAAAAAAAAEAKNSIQPAVERAVEPIRKELAETKNAIGPAVEKALEPLKKNLDGLQSDIKQHGTVGEQWALAQADVKSREPDASKAKQDLDSVKEMVHDHRTVFWTVGIIAVIGLVIVLVIWHAKTTATPAGTTAPAATLHPLQVGGMLATGNVAGAAALTASDVQGIVQNAQNNGLLQSLQGSLSSLHAKTDALSATATQGAQAATVAATQTGPNASATPAAPAAPAPAQPQININPASPAGK
jgi:hypothetical protein